MASARPSAIGSDPRLPEPRHRPLIGVLAAAGVSLTGSQIGESTTEPRTGGLTPAAPETRAEEPTAVAFDPKEQRRIFGHFATGVTVVSTIAGNETWGMTANAVTSLSLDPPLMLVAVVRDTSTDAYLKASRVLRGQYPGRRPEATCPPASRAPGRAISRTWTRRRLSPAARSSSTPSAGSTAA